MRARWRLLLAATATWACTEDGLSTAKGFISAAPSPLEFHDVPALGRAELVLRVSNDGTRALAIESVAVRNDERGAFSAKAPTAPLAGGSALELAVTFDAPAAAGLTTATLAITSDADNAPVLLVPLVASTRAPTCTDTVRNGTESAPDCGGESCPGCGAGTRCLAPRDCAPGLACAGGVCGSCSSASECRPGQICADGACEGCGADADCPDAHTCVLGACVACPGASGRIDTTSDLAHCGACNHACPAPVRAAARCVAGVCGRGPCEPGAFDFDGPATFGCETTCSGRTCRDAGGNVTTVSAPPLPESGATRAAAASGSSYGPAVQTSARWTHEAVLGESTPPAPESKSASFRHRGGLVGMDQ